MLLLMRRMPQMKKMVMWRSSKWMAIAYGRDQLEPSKGKRKNHSFQGYSKPVVNKVNPQEKVNPDPILQQTKQNRKEIQE